jgi:hypothetical protein
VPDCCGASALGGETQAIEAGEDVRGHRLSGAAAGEEPSDVGIGRGPGVRSLIEVGQQQPGEGLGNGGWRGAEPDESSLPSWRKSLVVSRAMRVRAACRAARARRRPGPGAGHPRDAGLAQQRGRWCWAIGAGLLVSRCGMTRGGCVLGAQRPSQEGVGEVPGGVAVCVPGVDVGVGGVGEATSALGEVVAEGGREADLVAGLPDLVAGQRPRSGRVRRRRWMCQAANSSSNRRWSVSPMAGSFSASHRWKSSSCRSAGGRTPVCVNRSRR